MGRNRTYLKTKDVRQISYFVENGVNPFKLEGFKGLLFAYFYEDEIYDLNENWFVACQEYKQQRDAYNKANNRYNK